VGTDGKAILVSLNMSPTAAAVSLDLKAAGVTGSRLETLMASPGPMASRAAADRITLPPFAAWVVLIH
jgi:hypothetical protein